MFILFIELHLGRFSQLAQLRSNKWGRYLEPHTKLDPDNKIPSYSSLLLQLSCQKFLRLFLPTMSSFCLQHRLVGLRLSLKLSRKTLLLIQHLLFNGKCHRIKFLTWNLLQFWSTNKNLINFWSNRKYKLIRLLVLCSERMEKKLYNFQRLKSRHIYNIK